MRRGPRRTDGGSIVVAGTGCGGDILVARYNPTGEPDTSLGSDGSVCLDVDAGTQDVGVEVLLADDGKTGRPCVVDVVPVNNTLKFADAQGVIGQTAGTLNRPPGQWQICFLDEGRVVTGVATYTVAG